MGQSSDEDLAEQLVLTFAKLLE